MEKIKEKLASLRAEADAAIERAERAEAKNKLLEQALLEREQEVGSKNHQLDDLEKRLGEASLSLKDTTERLRRVDVDAEHIGRQAKRYEEERDRWEKKFEEAQSKYRKTQAELDDLIANMDNL